MQFFIYGRKSVYTGRGDSIENQIELCRQYIQSRYPDTTLEEISIYEDEGFSGKNLNRPQFQRMLRDISRKKPDFLVCYRLDRISRNVSDFSALIESLNRDGISFLCIKEEFDTSKPMGKAMLYIASVFAQLERETIAERVRDNMLLLARTGRWLGGSPPLGYRSCQVQDIIFDGYTKKLCGLEVFPPEHAIVTKIFAYYLRLRSLSALEKQLTNERLFSRSSRPFSLIGLREILKNPVYSAADEGSYQYFKRHSADITFPIQQCCSSNGLMVYNKRDYTQCKSPRNPISHWIVALGRHPPIVSGGDWVAVQQLLEGTRPLEAPPHSDYSLLSGLLRCPCCNSAMFAKKRNRQDGFDYICQQKLRGGVGRCDGQNLAGDQTDEMVFGHLLPYLCPVGLLDTLKPLVKSSTESLFHQRELLEKKLQNCNHQRDNLIQSLAISAPSPTLIHSINEKLTQIDCEVKSLNSRLCDSDIDTSFLENSHDDIIATIQNPSSLTVREKRTLIRILVHHILWQEGSLTLFLRDNIALETEVVSPPSSQF